MNISIPDQLKAFVEEQISSGRYSSASEYVRELIRMDEQRKAQEQLERLLLEGAQDANLTPLGPEDWAAIRREALAQFQRRNGSRG